MGEQPIRSSQGKIDNPKKRSPIQNLADRQPKEEEDGCVDDEEKGDIRNAPLLSDQHQEIACHPVAHGEQSSYESV